MAGSGTVLVQPPMARAASRTAGFAMAAKARFPSTMVSQLKIRELAWQSATRTSLEAAVARQLRDLASAAGHGAEDDERLVAFDHAVGQRCVGWVVGQVLLARVEPDERPPLAAL